jgi:excisionase family DNA binding protein
MTEGHTEGDRRTAQVTVSQAAKILRVHRNTVHNYIKNGRLRASKIMEGGREYYLIEQDSLPNVHQGKHEHTLDAQPPTEHTEIAVMLAHRLEDLVQRYGQELGSVREELGAERVRREQAERERDKLAAELEALREPREYASDPLGSSESDEGAPYGTSPQEADESLLRRRSSWWRRFFGFDRGGA